MNLEQARQLAQDETTSPEILAELAINEDRQARQYAASNPNTPVTILLSICCEFPDEVMNNPVIPLLLLEDPYILTCKIPLDFNELIRLIDFETKRLGIKKSQAREYLIQTYGKTSRLHLTDMQLCDFLSRFRSMSVDSLPVMLTKPISDCWKPDSWQYEIPF